MALFITLATIGAILALVAGIYVLIGPDQEVEERLASGRVSENKKSMERSRGLSDKVNAELKKRRFGSQLAMEINQAGVQITPAEFIGLNIGLVVAALLLGVVVAKTLIAGVGIAALLGVAPRMWLKRKKSQRIANFQQQLPDVLNLIVGSLRAGYGLLQSMKLVAQEMPDPSKSEYGRVANEVALGYSLQEALLHLVERMESEDLSMVVTAINIQNEVGGNLGNILETIAGTIQDRVKLEGDVRAMTSMQRATGYLLASMPFFIGAFLLFASPEYITQLFVFPWYAIPIGAVVSMGFGIVLMNKITKLDF